MFKERPTKKLTERYVGPYAIKEVVLSNAVKLRLPSLMRIHLVVNVSQIVQYKEQVEGQKKEEGKPVEVERVEEWEVDKILNKKKIRGVEKYLVQWKCYGLKLKVLSNRTTLVLSNTRELNRVPSTK